MSSRLSGGFQPRCEQLETREVPSWGAIPPATLSMAPQDDHWTITGLDRRGNYDDVDSITHNEANYYTFTALRTGTYVFRAAEAGSRVDTVAALYDANGNRLAFNDDWDGRNSRFVHPLVAGQTYTFGVTNFNGTANGQYRVDIRAPAIMSGDHSSPNGWHRTSGSAQLDTSSMRLSLRLYGATEAWVGTAWHSIHVQILDVNGQPIHTGEWERGFRTTGSRIPGYPTRHTGTWDVDLSGWDLSRASSVHVRVRSR